MKVIISLGILLWYWRLDMYEKKTLNNKFKYLYIMCCWFLVVMIEGCFQSPINDVYNYNAKPDDEISKSIKKAVGKKLYYNGKDVNANLQYYQYFYLIKDYDDEDLIQKTIDAVECLLEEKRYSNQYIKIVFLEAFPGATEPVASVSNYYDTVDDYILCDGFKCLEIYGTTHSDHNVDSRYNDARTYIKLKNIKSLVCTKKIQESAEEEKIVWNDIWPDLDNYRIRGDDN